MSTVLTITPTESPTTMMNPFEFLSQKPIPQPYAIPPFSTNNKDDDSGSMNESSSDAKTTTSIHFLLQDRRMNHQDLDRQLLLQRLKTNGFLVQPCVEIQHTPSSAAAYREQQEAKMESIRPQKAANTLPTISSTGVTVERPALSNETNGDDTGNYGQKLKTKVVLQDQNTIEPIETDTEKESPSDDSVSTPTNIDSSTVIHGRDRLPPVTDVKQWENKEVQYDANTIFIVCNSKSTQKPPGKEPSEKIPKSRVDEFKSLGKVSDWRIRLCNTSDDSFVLDKITWKNVHHYYLAVQYKNQSIFSSLSQNYDLALQLEKDQKKKKKKQAVPDEDFSQRKRQEMYHALYAKFTQHPELARLLEATKDAHLMYRIDTKNKEEFTELMWLRESLRPYTLQVLKPLDENIEPAPVQENTKGKMDDKTDKQDKRTNVTDAIAIQEAIVNGDALGKYKVQLPQYKPEILRASSYYLNNRTQFVQSINQLFKNVKNRFKDGETNTQSNFSLLEHQRIALNYLHGDRPYHGLLVYHNLGTGKSCTSIAIAEGMKHDKKIVVLLPASLKSNYWSELQKCGDALYKQSQHWEFVSVDGQPDLIPQLSSALNLNSNIIRKNKGAFMVDARKEPNFANMSPEQQIMIQRQIDEMIQEKYKNIHYNANNLGEKVKALGQNKKNPFDHTVVILEEAHNFISRIVGNLKKKKKASNSVYVQIYEQMLQATDFRIVMLSGTPILNYPQEMGVMFNLLRGGIQTWTIEIQSNQVNGEKISTEMIERMFKKEGLVTYDYLQYQYGKLTLTKNPYGFINVDSRSRVAPAAPRGRVTEKQRNLPLQAKPTQTRKNVPPSIVQQQPNAPMEGGGGKYGVKLDSRGNVDAKQFEKKVKAIFEKNQIQIKKMTSKIEKALPDNDNFGEKFIRPVSEFKEIHNNTDSTDLQNVNTLRRRILGLTSYFRTANADVLPRIVMGENNNPIHEVRVPMSEHQIELYMKIRSQERDKEKKQKKQKQMRMGTNAELFDTASSYRVFSRCACNFTFPNDLKRPIPKGKSGNADDEAGVADNALQEHTIEDNTPVAMAEYQDEDAAKTDDFYQAEIAHVMRKLREKRDDYFSHENLQKYSPKMWSIIQNLKNPNHKGLHLLYSAFRTLEGIGIFKEVLIAQGYQEFQLAKTDGIWDFAPGFKLDERPCFVLYTGTEDVEMREIMRNIYNGDWNPPNVPESISIQLREVASNNLYGEIIQLFMITAAGAEGINLKNTRYVHMMEPYWNAVRLQQVQGRARRIKSHIDLPKPEQTVQTFLYLSVFSEEQKKKGEYKDLTENDLSKLDENTPITTDEYLYEISQIKEKVNQQLLSVMKETAMDCHVHIQDHKKQEKLVCYGPKSGDKEFVDYPSLDRVLEEESA